MMPIPWDYLQENLVTASEIARRLELTRTAVAVWGKRGDWPAPVLTFDAHSGTGESGFYWWPDIQSWCVLHNVEAGRGMPRGRPRKEPDGQDLVTRTEMAARRDVHISTMMTWIDRYPDFPAPARTDTPQPLWYWPVVEAYLDRKGLPRTRRADAAAAAAGRDARILAALGEFPDGLTERELADLTAADEPATDRFGQPGSHAVEVRIADRLRRLETAGKVRRDRRPGARRGTTIWLATPLPPAVSTG